MEDDIMRECNSLTSEAQSIENEIARFAESPQLHACQTIEPDSEFDDRESNSWIDALLRESSAEILDFGRVKLDAARRVVICNGRYARFAPLDFAMLLVMLRHRNKMLSYARICRLVWGPNRKLSVPRLRVRVFRVRQRLEEERLDGIHIISRGGLGYMLKLDSPALRRLAPRKELQSGPSATDTLRGLPSLMPSHLRSRRVATAAE
jgi:DNA-binding winged helix-turn-helix (wHTH) protein